MGGPVKVALGVLVAALVAVLIVSFTSGDDSSAPSTATVADGQPKGSADAKSDTGKGASKGSKKGGAGQGESSSSAAPIEEEAGFSGSTGSSEEESSSNGSGGNGSKGNGGKIGGSGASHGSGKNGNAKKKKKKKSKAASPAPGLDPETAAASAVLQTYMAARSAQDWPTACAQMAAKAIVSLERFAAAGRGCVATFSAVYPHLEPGVWTNTMSGPITGLRVEASGTVALYHGTTGRDYSMPMRKEGSSWKVAAVGPVAVP